VEAIEHLHQLHTYSVLDFGAEAKSKDEDFDKVLEENIRAIRFASSHAGIPVISSKITALAAFELLEKFQTRQGLTAEEQKAFERIENRLDTLCQVAGRK
jgi:proline dehydrogenase